MGNTLEFMLVPDAVLLNISANDAREVVTLLGGLLQDAGFVKSTFVEAALEREKTMPTGLPLAGEINAAIPHTDIEHVIKPGVALATLVEPVVFQNMIAPEEGVLVRLVFLLALNQPKAQVEMLQQVASVLQTPAVVEGLINATDMNSIRKLLASEANLQESIGWEER